MAQQLRACTVLVGGLNLDSSAHVEWLTITYNSVLGNLPSSSVFHGQLRSHAQMHAQSYMYHTETYI